MAATAEQPVLVLVAGVSDYQIQMLAGISGALRSRGVPLLVVALVNYDSSRTAEILLELIARHVPQGVICLADEAVFRRPELVPALQRSELPIVSIGLPLESAPLVATDCVPGVRALMRHLLDECGVRRLAVVRGIPDHVDSLAREAVLREEFATRGITVDEDLVVDGYFLGKAAYDQMRELLNRRTDIEAVFAFNDASAFGALAALTDEGIRVPQDVLLAGFDNSLVASATWPPLTSVDPHLGDQTAQAVDMVLRLSGGLPCPQRVEISAGLAVRTSTRRDALDISDAMACAQALQSRVVVHELATQISTLMAGCETVDDVRRTLAACLDQLEITRCFFVLYAGTGSSGSSEASGSFAGEVPSCRLVFSYRQGDAEQPPEESFHRHDLLPSPLRGELEHGGLLLIPLTFEGRERGYLLYDLDMPNPALLEALRMEVPRTVEMVLSRQELTDRTSMLERLIGQRTRQLERIRADLERAVQLDGLTGIANRRAFETFLARLCEPEAETPVALLMIDVDLFKPYNDRYGHLQGDEALRTVADCLRRSVRGKQDLACRYGGEEFAVVLAGGDVVAARAVAQRFADLLAAAAIPHEASPVAGVVTASIGIATVADGRQVQPVNLIAAADRALYEAKAAGRHRIVVATAPVPPQRRVPTEARQDG